MDREAAVYVQGYGLKVVAPCFRAVLNSRFTRPMEAPMSNDDRAAALEQLTTITLTLEQMIAQMDELYDRLARQP